MNKKEFRFQGLDSKTELNLALKLIVPVLVIMIGILYGSSVIFPKLPFLISLFVASILALSISMFLLKKLSDRIRQKEWLIGVENDSVSIKFRDENYNFRLSDVKMIKNLGNVGLRYLTIKTDTDVIKIRVGNSGLAPFSTQADIDEVDAFVAYIKPFINEHFNTKILKNIANCEIMPNFGVYVVKGENIKYSVINKMKPWQVILFILGIGVLVMVLFMTGILYYIDNK